MAYQYPIAPAKPPRPGTLLAALIVSTILTAISILLVVLGMVAILSVASRYGGSIPTMGWVMITVPFLLLVLMAVGVVIAYLDKPAGRIIYATGAGLYLVLMIIGAAQNEMTGTASSSALLFWMTHVIPVILFFLPSCNRYYAALAGGAQQAQYPGVAAQYPGAPQHPEMPGAAAEPQGGGYGSPVAPQFQASDDSTHSGWQPPRT